MRPFLLRGHPPAKPGFPGRDRCSGRAFSIIELLVVIAAISVLAAILVPSLTAARRSVKRTETRVRFAQWAAAIEQFRQEYGHNPALATSGNLLEPTAFLAALTGRDYLGTTLSGPALGGNAKAIAFHSVAESEFVKNAAGAATNELCDTFGNSDIVVLLDSDGNGVVSGTELARRAVRVGNSRVGYGPALTPPEDAFPAEGIRARVLLYSAGAGSGADDVVFSWK